MNNFEYQRSKQYTEIDITTSCPEIEVSPKNEDQEMNDSQAIIYIPNGKLSGESQVKDDYSS